MKTKKTLKKMTINKKTVANLNEQEMKSAQGGLMITFIQNCLSFYACL